MDAQHMEHVEEAGRLAMEVNAKMRQYAHDAYAGGRSKDDIDQTLGVLLQSTAMLSAAVNRITTGVLNRDAAPLEIPG